MAWHLHTSFETCYCSWPLLFRSFYPACHWEEEKTQCKYFFQKTLSACAFIAESTKNPNKCTKKERVGENQASFHITLHIPISVGSTTQKQSPGLAVSHQHFSAQTRSGGRTATIKRSNSKTTRSFSMSAQQNICNLC